MFYQLRVPLNTFLCSLGIAAIALGAFSIIGVSHASTEPLNSADGRIIVNTPVRTPAPMLVYDENMPVNNDTIEAGQTLLIFSYINNTSSEYVPYTIFIEVRNEDDVTEFLMWNFDRLPPKQAANLYMHWTAEKEGTYQLRTFAISDDVNRDILTAVESSSVHVAPKTGEWVQHEIGCVGARCDVRFLTYAFSNANSTDGQQLIETVGSQFGDSQYGEVREFIDGFYRELGIPILSMKMIPIQMSHCEWGECQDILLLEVKVTEADYDTMIDLGYMKSHIPNHIG